MTPIKVALVEDDPDDQEFISMALNDSGHNVAVTAFRSGQSFVSALTEFLPDVVITDLRMPLMSGFDVIGHLKSGSDTCRIPVVVLSTSGSGEDKERATELGASAYYVKPFSLEGYTEITGEILQKFNGGVLHFLDLLPRFRSWFDQLAGRRAATPDLRAGTG